MVGEVGDMGGSLVQVAKLVRWVAKLVRWTATVIEMHGAIERHCLLRQLPGFETTHLSKIIIVRRLCKEVA
jgi:hypothetical protein